MVAELCRHEEEACLEDTQRHSGGNSVEVLELDLRDHVLVRLKGDLGRLG